MHQLKKYSPSGVSLGSMSATTQQPFCLCTAHRQRAGCVAVQPFIHNEAAVRRFHSQCDALRYVVTYAVHALPPFVSFQTARFTRRRSFSLSLITAAMSALSSTPFATHTAAMSSSFTTSNCTNFLPMRLYIS